MKPKRQFPKHEIEECMWQQCGCDSKPQHTPTPWKFHLGRGANPRFHIQTEGGYQIASTTELVRHSQAHEENAMREANVAFIVRAVNCHEESFALIEELVTTLLSYVPFAKLTESEKHMLFEANQLTRPEKAIAKAEGK